MNTVSVSEKDLKLCENQINELDALNMQAVTLGQLFADMKQKMYENALLHLFTPERILKSGAVTIVFWGDGTKTMVRCSETETPDDYDAFTAALAIKVFGSNSKLKRVIRNKTVIQKPKKGKA